MLTYRHDLKQRSRSLRSNMTEAETKLWQAIRGKQLLCVQFFRQRPIGPYIVDFYAPTVKLVIEVDGGQHLELDALERDNKRTGFLESQGLTVLRFDNLQVLTETESVLEMIHRFIGDRQSLPTSLLQREGSQ